MTARIRPSETRLAQFWQLRKQQIDLEAARQALIAAGGQHVAARGTSTTDGMSDADCFEMERQRAAVSMDEVQPW